FETVAKQYSEDPSVQKNGGNLGYFSAFAMVYPFENAAYQTNVGEISQPFRTQFGYHIVKVNAVRDSKGEVEVAHIMIKNDKKDSLQAKTKIYELFAKLNQGMDFELLARQQSEDRSSAVNGGKLAKFNATRMIKSFADVAFSLKNENDISTPFQTRYGWHIVKLIKKYPIGDFNSVKDELTQKIEKSKRYKLAGTSIVKRLIKEYHITKNTELLQSYFNNDTAVISKNSATAIFSINGVTTALGELIKYGRQRPNKSTKDIFTDFFETKVLAYYKDNLEKTDPSFAFTLQEYKDGLLLFDLLQDKVWKRAEQDTLGLKAFFTKNQDKYFWKKRGDVIIASCTRKDKALLVKKYLEEGKEIDEIKKLVNDGPIIHVLFTRRVVEENHDKLPKGFVFDTVGVSDVIDDGNGFTIVKTFQIMPPQPMLLSEAKGNVINDYQDYLDKQWIRELRQQYPVKVKKKVLKKLIKQNQQ
ncbi:MAG TPA: peptidylprolyl isomerase, partial [Flavobacteriia bacterium]|nr:peptidylprolyl isomerase [Flavobacteriia bacterium]